MDPSPNSACWRRQYIALHVPLGKTEGQKVPCDAKARIGRNPHGPHATSIESPSWHTHCSTAVACAVSTSTVACVRLAFFCFRVYVRAHDLRQLWSTAVWPA